METPARHETVFSPGHRHWLLAVLVPGCILAAGVALRAAEYLYDKALWLDEAYVALNVLDRDYAALLRPLEFGQAAPIGFLYAVRFAVERWGGGEYVLRMVPLLGSLAALVLFGWLVRRWVSLEAAAVAFGLFALSQPLVRYAAELKPYATDVTVTLVLLGLATAYLRHSCVWRAALLAVAGALAIWCAYPALFVLAGVGVTLAAAAVGDRRWGRLAVLTAVGSVWLLSFAAYYFVSLRTIGGNKEVMGWWSDAYMPLLPYSPTHINWFVRTFLDLFQDPIGIPLAGLGALAFILGTLSLLFRDRRVLALLLSPVAVALLVSGFQRYPFTGRFLLFAVPLVLPVIGEGFEVLRKRSRTTLLYALALLLIFVQPVLAGVRTVAKPERPQGIRPAYAYLLEHYEAGDAVYLYHWAQFPFRYCMKRDGVDLPFRAGVTARAEWNYYIEDMNTFLGAKRVWFVFTNTPKELTGEEEKFFLTWLDTQGMRMESFQAPESSVYRYDLSGARMPVDKDD